MLPLLCFPPSPTPPTTCVLVDGTHPVTVPIADMLGQVHCWTLEVTVGQGRILRIEPRKHYVDYDGCRTGRR